MTETLTVGELRRILADASLPDEMPVVSWHTDFTGIVDAVGVVAVTKETHEQTGGLFIGQDATTAGMDEIEPVRLLFGELPEDGSQDGPEDEA